MPDTKLELKWIETTCPVCHRKYKYLEGGYKPSTCGEWECLHKWLHDPKYNKESRK